VDIGGTLGRHARKPWEDLPSPSATVHLERPADTS